MRKTVIALLLVVAMLMVSCKPGGAEVKEPTADEFFEAYYAQEAVRYVTESLVNAKDESGNIDKSNISLDTLTEAFTDASGLKRYSVTEVTEVTGNAKSKDEAENVVISFKYYTVSRTSKTTDWPDVSTYTNEPSTGVLAFSFKRNTETTEWTYKNIKLNFNPYKDGNTPSLNSTETTAFKDISITLDSETGKVASAAVAGVKLTGSEWTKVDAVLNVGH